MGRGANISGKMWMGLILMALLYLPHSVSAQEDKTLGELEESARELFESQDYLKALDLYKELAAKGSASALINYRIGICMYNLKDQRFKAGVYFEKAVFGMPQDMYTPLTVEPEVLESYYYLGKHYHQEEEFDIALNMYQTYQNYRGLYTGLEDNSARAHSLQEIDNLINNLHYIHICQLWFGRRSGWFHLD